jgi:hypothetical protein
VDLVDLAVAVALEYLQGYWEAPAVAEYQALLDKDILVGMVHKLLVNIKWAAEVAALGA